MNSLPLFPTSIIGSMPRPAHVQELIAGEADRTDAGYRAHMEAAIRDVVAMQEEAGLDVVSDGEWWRKSYIGVIAELANGFELSQNPADGRPWTIVVDRLSPRQPGFIASEVEYLKTLTGRAIKATLPAPALLGERMWDREKSSAAYPTREDFVQDCVPVLRREVELLQQSGASIIQVDDPHLCLFVDDQVRAGYKNPDQAADFSVEMNNQLIDGIEGVTMAVHLCRRAGARARGEADHAGGFEKIMPQLGRLRAGHITLEFTTPGAGEMSVLKQLPEHVEVGLGCVSCLPGQVDSVATIVERVEAALEYLEPGRLTLNPDCGFAPGSAAEVSIEEVFTKLQNEVEAARQLRETYG
jgi:5-methyltetrahydropteroyltriglutamate--homocysteine methyltransferase